MLILPPRWIQWTRDGSRAHDYCVFTETMIRRMDTDTGVWAIDSLSGTETYQGISNLIFLKFGDVICRHPHDFNSENLWVEKN